MPPLNHSIFLQFLSLSSHTGNLELKRINLRGTQSIEFQFILKFGNTSVVFDPLPYPPNPLGTPEALVKGVSFLSSCQVGTLNPKFCI